LVALIIEVSNLAFSETVGGLILTWCQFRDETKEVNGSLLFA
jgi:hypothetical protein